MEDTETMTDLAGICRIPALGAPVDPKRHLHPTLIPMQVGI